MNKDVLISIKGLQYTVSEEKEGDTRVETLTRGQYYKRAGKHYVTFEEALDGDKPVKSMVKFDETSFEITRKGPYNVRLGFEAGKKAYTDYRTPFGEFLMGIDTTSIEYGEKENEILMRIEYDMEFNSEQLGRCVIDVKVTEV
ncbi:MAG: DUF1934 domain-containing protein [Lachnospiraceae bacterium]|nr:DUF1934 domain-containing protein [Lachnospiraceae bacterium]